MTRPEIETKSPGPLVNITGGKIVAFIHLLRVLTICEMQAASSRIRTRVAMSISYSDNRYTTGASVFQKYNSQGLSNFLLNKSL